MVKILMVEDDVMIIRALEAYLLREGFAPTAVSSERQALEAMEQGSADLLQHMTWNYVICFKIVIACIILKSRSWMER